MIKKMSDGKKMFDDKRFFKSNLSRIKDWVKRKRQGRTIMEEIATLFIFTLVTLVILNIYGNTMKNYLRARHIDNEAAAIYEALMYIDYYVNYCGEEYYIEDSRLYIEGENGKGKGYFYLYGSDLRVAYKNSSGSGYTSQPLLYDVKEFTLSENNKVTFVEIITRGGQKIKKAIGRI